MNGLATHTLKTERSGLKRADTYKSLSGAWKKLGWTGDSKMISRYIHCVDDDVIDATMEKNGTHILPKPQVKTMNPAQSVNIVDVSGTIAKVNAENDELKKGYDELKRQMELLTAAMQAKQQS